MPRESIDQKALRYVREGRLRILNVDGDLIVAHVRGSTGEMYALGHDPRNHEWRCSCPAPRRCAHLAALQLVTMRRRKGSDE